jgi:large subunit ribosomal protein L29
VPKNAPTERSGYNRLTNSMKIKEIIEMSTDELLTKRRDLRQESLHLRLQQQSGQLEQPSRLRLLRRDVARIETVLSKRDKESAKT